MTHNEVQKVAGTLEEMHFYAYHSSHRAVIWLFLVNM